MGQHKKKARGTFSDNNTPLYIFGIDELVKKLEKCESQMQYAIPIFIERQAQPFYNALYKFMSPPLHYRNHVNGTPNTRDFLGQWMTISRDKKKYTYRVGFRLKEGEMAGLPALFLDLGTRPHNVMRERQTDKQISYVNKKGTRVSYTLKKGVRTKAPHIEPTYFVYFARKEAERSMMENAPKLMEEILKEVMK